MTPTTSTSAGRPWSAARTEAWRLCPPGTTAHGSLEAFQTPRAPHPRSPRAPSRPARRWPASRRGRGGHRRDRPPADGHGRPWAPPLRGGGRRPPPARSRPPAPPLTGAACRADRGRGRRDAGRQASREGCEDHPPGGRLDHVANRDLHLAPDLLGRVLDHDHRAVLEIADALPVLAALLHEADRSSSPAVYGTRNFDANALICATGTRRASATFARLWSTVIAGRRALEPGGPARRRRRSRPAPRRAGTARSAASGGRPARRARGGRECVGWGPMSPRSPGAPSAPRRAAGSCRRRSRWRPGRRPARRSTRWCPSRKVSPSPGGRARLHPHQPEEILVLGLPQSEPERAHRQVDEDDRRPRRHRKGRKSRGSMSSAAIRSPMTSPTTPPATRRSGLRRSSFSMPLTASSVSRPMMPPRT